MAHRMRIAGLLALFGMPFLATAPSLAAPLCPSGVALQALISLGSCAIGDKVFSGFGVAANTFSGITQLDFTAAEVTVSVDPTPLNPGFVFGFQPLSVGRDQLKEGQINFAVTVSPGGAPIEDVALTDSAAAQGDGFASVSVDLSNNVFGAIVTNAVQGEQVCTPSCVPGTLAELPFAPVTSLAVTAAILLNDNASQNPGPQGASLSAFTVNFSEVPEPGVVPVVVFALALFAGLSRRRRVAT